MGDFSDGFVNKLNAMQILEGVKASATIVFNVVWILCSILYVVAYMAMEENLSHAGNMEKVDFFQVVCRIYEIQLRECQVDLLDGEGIWH